MFATLLALMVSVGQSQPNQITEAPAASAKMLSQNQFQLRWHGVGDLRATAQMCVTSTTGRFQLEIQPISMTAGRVLSPDFEIVVSTKTGENAVQKSRSVGTMTFEGRTLPNDCMGTGNVTVELRFQRDDLTETIAGEYLKRVQISVRPA